MAAQSHSFWPDIKGCLRKLSAIFLCDGHSLCVELELAFILYDAGPVLEPHVKKIN